MNSLLTRSWAGVVLCLQRCVVVFLDLSKAFHTVNHKILKYRIRGLVLKLMKSFLQIVNSVEKHVF